MTAFHSAIGDIKMWFQTVNNRLYFGKKKTSFSKSWDLQKYKGQKENLKEVSTSHLSQPIKQTKYKYIKKGWEGSQYVFKDTKKEKRKISRAWITGIP